MINRQLSREDIEQLVCIAYAHVEISIGRAAELLDMHVFDVGEFLQENCKKHVDELHKLNSLGQFDKE